MPETRSLSLSPRLVGPRFDDHTIPLEMLKDLAALEGLLLELARDEWLKAHPERKRTPRGFIEGVSLNLTGVGKGSAVAEIQVCFDQSDLFPDAREFVSLAFETLIEAVADASSASPRFGILPKKLLGYLNRLGRSLKSGEYIEFPSATTVAVARLTQETRHKLLRASSATYSDKVTLWGTVVEADKDKCTFNLQLLDQRRIEAPLESEHADQILEAFDGWENGVRIRLHGVGKVDLENKILRVESIEQATLLDPLDVPARLDEFRLLKDGWLDGHGVPPRQDGLDWLAEAFTFNYPERLSLPYTFPTEGGGVRFEWSQNPIDASLEIDLSKKTAWWHTLNHESDADSEETLDLSGSAGWTRLAQLLDAHIEVAK